MFLRGGRAFCHTILPRARMVALAQAQSLFTLAPIFRAFCHSATNSRPPSRRSPGSTLVLIFCPVPCNPVLPTCSLRRCPRTTSRPQHLRGREPAQGGWRRSVLAPPLTAGGGGQETFFSAPFTGLLGVGLQPWLKPNTEKPRERGSDPSRA